MANLTKVPDAYGQYIGSSFGGWQESDVASSFVDVFQDARTMGAYLLRFGVQAASVSSCSLEVRFSFGDVYGTPVYPSEIRCYLYRGTNANNASNLITSQSFTVNRGDPVTHRFSFSNLDIRNVSNLCFRLEAVPNSGNIYAGASSPSVSASYTLAALGMAVSPTALLTGEKVTLTFTNRLNQNVAVEFWNGSTRLHRVTASGNTLDVNCPASWFSTAGQSGNSMQVDVRASDPLERTASGRFTLIKPQASPATPTAPKSTSVSGGSPIRFTWTVDETYGEQTSAEIQFNQDNTWFSPEPVTGSGKVYTANAYLFKAGTVSWRVRTVNELGLQSDWSAPVSFTVTYPALGVTASPATVFYGYPVTLNFSNLITYTTAEFRANGVLLTTITTTDDSKAVSTSTSWFSAAGVSAETMRVDVAVTDRLGRSASTSFTLSKYVASPATPTAPKSTSVSGTAAIPFSWTVDESASVQTRAELQWSTDNVNWSALATVSGSTKTYSAPAWKFRAGTVYWRVRATNKLGTTGNWSSSVSFTVAYPALGLSPSPAQVPMNGDSVLTFSNLLSRRWTMQVKSGSTPLRSEFSGTGESVTIPFYADWFLAAGVTGNTLNVDVSATDDLGRTATARVVVSKTAITLSLSADSLYTGNTITATLGNTQSRPYTLVFRHNTQELYSVSGTGNGGRSVSCPASWFSTAGVSGSSMRVDVAVTDDLGRTAAANFTLIKPQGSTFTPTAPKSTTVDGAATVNFAWTVSSDWGTQTKAELLWSQDNAVFHRLATIEGNVKTWTAPAVQFPAGTIYWKGRVTNSFGVVGEYSNAVSFTVNYAAVSQAVPVNSPTGGIINAAAQQRFSIHLQASGPVYDEFTVASATFYWRDVSSADFIAVEMTPSGFPTLTNATVTIPAGTFPSGAIQWYATAVDNTGAESSTAVFTLETLNAVVEAQPLSPISTVESGSGPIGFRWSYGSLDGSAQTAAELQWSQDGELWQALGSVRGSATSWTAPADTFEAGTVYWRVRAANSAGTWGPWSQAVSFVCFSAPHVTGVRGDGVPFLTVTWQTVGQLAYEVRIGAKTYGPYFGEDARSFTLSEPLAPGSYSIAVRAQNRYGLWSEWQTGEVAVTNAENSFFSIGASALPDGDNVQKTHARVVVSSSGGAVMPNWITVQPRDLQTTEPEKALFYVSFANTLGNSTGHWEIRIPGRAEPITTTESSVTTTKKSLRLTSNASVLPQYDGAEIRYVLTNNVGTAVSRPATFRYLAPTQYNAPEDTTPSYPDTGFFLVYRNFKLIGKTYSPSFIDRFGVGSSIYTVQQALPGGYYRDGIQSTPAVVIEPSCPIIGLVSDGDFLPLRLSELAQRSQSYRRQREVVYTQYAGAVFPEAEIGEHEALSVSFDAAWLKEDAADAKKFEAMLGKPVILKTPGLEVIVGVLEGYERRDPRFYRAYSCTLQQMNWRDFSDES